MSFFSISDPIERDRVVKDYERMKREIQERSENRKMMSQNRNRTLQETFHPIVKAQNEMTEKIVKSLQENPIKKEKEAIPTIKRRLSSGDEFEPPSREQTKEEVQQEFGPLESHYRNRYMSRADDIDTSFGISFLSDGEPYIGNTPIKIEDDDIIIYSDVYPGTPGLWSLITEKKKANLKGKYDENDLAEYGAILRQTNALHQDFNPKSAYPRSSSSWKWRAILAPIWEKWKEDGEKDGMGLINDTPEQLADAVTDLLKRIHQDIETYKGLLDRLGRMGCVNEEENLGMIQAIQDKVYA